MTRVLHVFLGLALVSAIGCKKEQAAETAEKDKAAEPAKAAPAATPATADGVRTVPIAANENGYVPDKISGKPGEKLKLRFTRTVEGECLEKLKTPDGKVVDLPMNTPVDIEVTVPETGEVKFACGMEMFTGVVVAEKA